MFEAGFRFEIVEAASRHLEQRAADRLEILGVAGEQVQALDRRLVRDAAGDEQFRIGIGHEVRVDAKQVLARHSDQELLDAAAHSETGRRQASPRRTT